MMRLRFLGASVGVVVLVGAMPADAHAKRYSSTLTITQAVYLGDTTFNGTLTSAQALCMDGRTVNVFSNGTQVATGTTASDGSWSVDTGPGDYTSNVTAVALKRVIRRNARHSHICKAASAVY